MARSFATRDFGEGSIPAGTELTWDYEYRPRWMNRAVAVACAIVMIIHITFGLLLDVSYTGVNVRWVDKAALICVGILICAVLVYLSRSRLRVGPAGVGVRNMVGERIFGWDQVIGMAYPEKGFCARLLFPGDEHVPVMAVQARDADLAVEAMGRFRDLYEQYAPDRGESGGSD
ncbi:PH domain-containing protein [Gordonia shandongensis]|uniref:PH domain-containing protein n=1 Tax=Gordonia shandongensis TaxID=376351 RepID=UPI0009FC0E10|nr:PH domain-containing protein [Gordonia shandongensis]